MIRPASRFGLGRDTGDLENAHKHISVCGFADYWRDDAEEVARIIVRENWTAILRVAKALHERGALTGDEVFRLCREKKSQ
jgi:hypothetical protein